MEQPGLAQWSNPAWRADLHLFFTLYGKVGSDDPTRQCSNRTQALRRDVLGSTFSLLKSRNRGVRTLSQLTPRHIPEIIDIWSEALPSGQPRQLPSTQVANFSVLRWFWKLHGIKTDPIATYITDPLRRTLYTREMVASRDKSWEGNGVDVDEIIRLAAEEDPVLERIIIMAKEFGLRAREALSMDPNEADGGDRLRVAQHAQRPNGGVEQHLLINCLQEAEQRRHRAAVADAFQRADDGDLREVGAVWQRADQRVEVLRAVGCERFRSHLPQHRMPRGEHLDHRASRAVVAPFRQNDRGFPGAPPLLFKHDADHQFGDVTVIAN